jgi:hypothetical protein
LEGRVLKKGRKSVRNREVWERSLEGSFCFITQKPPNLVELKIVLEGFRDFGETST